MLGFEDDVVIDFCFNMLEKTQFPEPREMQMNLTGFLYGKNARVFMQELWDLLSSAQDNVGGIPAVFLEEKKEEIRQMKREKERIEASIKRQDDKTREQVEERHHQRERDARESEMDVPRRDRDSTSNEKNNSISRDKKNKCESPLRTTKHSSETPPPPDTKERNISPVDKNRTKSRSRSPKRVSKRSRSRSPKRSPHRLSRRSRSPHRTYLSLIHISEPTRPY